MSGHSKWKTIQHKKGAADAKRGKIFSKLSKELMVVARQGGSDPGMNPNLRTLIQKAKSSNMPADNIERAVKKGAGELEGSTYDEITYEGFAAGGVGLVVQVLTDNRNRATAEVRHVFTQHNSSFAQQNSVTRGFERKGQILVDATIVDEDALMDVVIEAGGDDLKRDGDQFEILTDPTAFADVSEALEKAEIPALSAEVTLLAMSYLPIAERNVASSVLRFINDLEDNEDVQSVYHNMEMSEEVMEALAAEA
jgi:YebC/PmpR family DNA-binding regulatory protein